MIWLWLLACQGGDPKDDPVDTDVTDDTDDTDVVQDTDLPDDTGGDPCVRGATAVLGEVGWGSLQAAVDASEAGDTIELCPGVHTGGARIGHGGPLTLASRDGDPANTTLDGGGTGQLLTALLPTIDLTLRGITFRAGRSDDLGGAVSLRADATLRAGQVTVDSCVFEGNSSVGPGSGAWLYGIGAVTVRDSVFAGNTAYSGPSLLIEVPRHRVLVERSSFTDNTGGRSGGVGIVHSDSVDVPMEIVVADSVFSGNISPFDGGPGTALYVDAHAPYATTVLLDRCTFTDNHELRGADDLFNPGGAVFLAGRSGVANPVVTVRDTLFDGNTGYHFAHLGIGNINPDATMTATIERVRFWRGDSAQPVYPVDEAQAGAALAPYLPAQLYSRVEVVLTEVDVGSGPTANARQDFGGCETDYDGVVSGLLVPVDGDYCP